MNWKWLILALVAVAWGALYLSSSGVLVGERVVEARQPGKGDKFDTEALIGALSQITSGGKVLECRYFTGIGVVRRVEPYDENGTLGRTVCPRIVDLNAQR